MRRSLFAGIGVVAVLALAACSPDQTRRDPLAPGDVGLAKGGGGGGGSGQCAGGLASQIAKQEGNNFTSAQASELSSLFNVIKSECSTSTVPSPALLAYLQRVADFRLLNGTVDGLRADSLLALWKSVTEYATGTPIDRPPVVFITGHPPTNPPQNSDAERGGGAAVLDPTATPQKLTMTTWDGQAGVKISGDQTPTGPHLITLYPAPCPGTTLLSATDDCYNVQSYPHVDEWSPLVEIGMCIHGGGAGPNTAISHFDDGYGTQVLPDGGGFNWSTIGCYANDHAFMDTWLGRKAGPLGRALAMGLDYLRPRPLFADDAGESGLGLFFSPFGGVKTKIFEETFDAPGNGLGPFPQEPNEVAPDIGDSWDVYAPSPGYVEIVDGSVLAPNGGLPGQVIAISQAGGACKKNCPTYRLLGTRVNPTPADEIGVYEVTWKSLQNKPNIKEAPFVLLSASGAEIARLSYVSESNQNRIKYNGTVVGTWTQNQATSFKIIVRLKDNDDTTTDYRTILYIDDMDNPIVKPGPSSSTEWVFKTTNQKTFITLGYRLDGIDAGIMAADNIVVRRLPDKP